MPPSPVLPRRAARLGRSRGLSRWGTFRPDTYTNGSISTQVALPFAFSERQGWECQHGRAVDPGGERRVTPPPAVLPRRTPCSGRGRCLSRLQPPRTDTHTHVPVQPSVSTEVGLQFTRFLCQRRTRGQHRSLAGAKHIHPLTIASPDAIACWSIPPLTFIA